MKRLAILAVIGAIGIAGCGGSSPNYPTCKPHHHPNCREVSYHPAVWVPFYYWLALGRAQHTSTPTLRGKAPTSDEIRSAGGTSHEADSFGEVHPTDVVPPHESISPPVVAEPRVSAPVIVDHPVVVVP